MSQTNSRFKTLRWMALSGAFILPEIGVAQSIGGDFHDSHATFRLGVMNYTKTDGETPLAGSGSVLNYEYSRYLRLDQAIVLGFRQATDAATQRDAYHSAYAGYRMFPFGLGFPLTSSVGDAVISMDSSYKLYGEGSIGLGRIMYAPISDGAGEFASDTLAIAFGGGVMMHFFSRWAVDFQLMYEIVQSRGGTGGSLAVSGSNIYILIGNGYLF